MFTGWIRPRTPTIWGWVVLRMSHSERGCVINAAKLRTTHRLRPPQKFGPRTAQPYRLPPVTSVMDAQPVGTCCVCPKLTRVRHPRRSSFNQLSNRSPHRRNCLVLVGNGQTLEQPWPNTNAVQKQKTPATTHRALQKTEIKSPRRLSTATQANQTDAEECEHHAGGFRGCRELERCVPSWITADKRRAHINRSSSRH